MTTEQRATPCGPGGPGGPGREGCRGAVVGRAEAFARSLHHKLRNLGGGGQAPAARPSLGLGLGPASPADTDDSWSSATSGPSGGLRTLSTSSIDSSLDLFYDLDMSPQSPQEEVTSQELAGMMAGSLNQDNLHCSNGSNGPQSPQSDCSSDYFDPDGVDEDCGPRLGTPPDPIQRDGDAPLESFATVANGVLSNGDVAAYANGHHVTGATLKPKRPWNRVPHKYKAGTPEAMSEVSALTNDDVDDEDDEDPTQASRQSRSRKVGTSTKPGLAKLSFPKSSQTLMQEGLIEQLKRGLEVPPELKNGLCPSSCGETSGSPAKGLAAMKEVARTLDALQTPEEDPETVVRSERDFSENPTDLRLKGDHSQESVAPTSRPVPMIETGCDGGEEEVCVNGQREQAADDCESEANEDDDRRPRVRRCSSLKTGKTPPGTPGRKKIVRFADVLGLDLADVRTFLDEIPKVPSSAYSDLQDVEPQDAMAASAVGEQGCLPSGLPQLALAFHAVPPADLLPYGARPHITRVLVPLFQQPGGLVDFLDRVRDRQVCLENAVVADPALLSIAGQVRVRNLDFHKTVHVRYTTDGWRTFADLQATYVSNSCDGFSDKFTFTLFAGHTMSVGQRLELAVRFQCKGQQYWDNNNGANYCFQCLPPSGAPPPLPCPSVPSLSSPCGDGWKFLF